MDNTMQQSEIKSVTLKKIERVGRLGTWQEHLLSVEATIDFELWFDECEDWIMPKCECEYSDDSNQMHFWMDNFRNVHWLVKVPSGHVEERVVYIGDKLQELADEKYAEHLEDMKLDNQKF